MMTRNPTHDPNYHSAKEAADRFRANPPKPEDDPRYNWAHERNAPAFWAIFGTALCAAAIIGILF